MATITMNTTSAGSNARLLESVAVTNTATTTITKGVDVPAWAQSALFLLNVTVMTGTTPLIDLNFKGVSPWTLDTTHIWTLGDFAGITQLTAAASPVEVAVEIAPGLTADNTGSATASCRYAINSVLPPVIVYNIAYDGTTADEDYTFTFSVFYR